MSRLNIKAETPTEQRLLNYLEANASDSLAERINTGKKTLRGAWSYITDWAMKEFKPTPQNPTAGTDDAEVFGRLVHYFEEDDIDFEKKQPVAAGKVVGGQPFSSPVRPKKGSKTKVVTAVPDKSGGVDLDSMLADLNIEVVGEEKKPEPKPEPEAPPAPEERKEPQQMDWLAEFGISV